MYRFGTRVLEAGSSKLEVEDATLARDAGSRFAF